jgi:hypothetical protein
MRIKALALLALSCGAALAADDAPAWLKELGSVTLPSYDAKVNTVVLLNEEQTVVADSGRLTTTTRTAIKFLTTVGTDVLFLEQYDTGSSKVKDFRAWMLAPTGKVKKYGKEEILDVACAENDVYNECRRRVVSGKRDAQTGAIFAYESVVERQLFVNQLAFRYQDSSPVRLAKFSVTAPSGWEVKSLSFNGAPAEHPPAGGAYSWQMENLPAIEREPASPSSMTLAPWTGVHLLGGGKRASPTWSEAARLLSDMNQGVAEPNDAITAKAKALTAGAATELDRIRAIGKFVQQLNYVSVQVDVGKGGGYKPHPAATVFQHLYGDCKDKANLMRAMLKAVGIDAYPVAIYSGDRTHVTREWASLGAFNHAISAIRVSAGTTSPAVFERPGMGRLMLFDPTDPYTPPGFIPRHEQGSLALIGLPEGGDLTEVPAAPPVADARERTVDATLAPDGALTGGFVEKRTGEELADAIGEYRGMQKSEYVKMIERWVGRGVPGAVTSDIEAAENGDAFVTKGHFRTARYAQSPQARMLIFRAAPLRHFDTPSLSGKVRKHPMVIDADALSETSRIALPEGFQVDELPEAVRLTSPFGKFEAKWTVDRGAVVFQRKIEIPAQSIPAANYADLRKFLDSVNGAQETPVVLVRK